MKPEPMTPPKKICGYCGEEMTPHPIYGKLMIHKLAGNIYCQYGTVERNGAPKEAHGNTSVPKWFAAPQNQPGQGEAPLPFPEGEFNDTSVPN